jgi:hypothetical protein
VSDTGAKRRIKLFAKGNVDVHDALVYSRVNGKIAWNGINDALAELGYAAAARVEHEVASRFDHVLIGTRPVPAEIVDKGLFRKPFTAEAQFRTALFDTDADAIILSIQPSVTNALLRHRRDGYLFFPSGAHEWSAEEKAWVRGRFERLPPQTPDEAMASLEGIVALLRQAGDRPILVLNMSFVVPSERVHRHLGADDSVSTRIRRFNLALLELASRAPISVVDVDDVIARMGAARVKLDTLRYRAAGYRAIAEAVVRVLADYGLLRPAVSESDAATP